MSTGKVAVESACVDMISGGGGRGLMSPTVMKFQMVGEMESWAGGGLRGPCLPWRAGIVRQSGTGLCPACAW